MSSFARNALWLVISKTSSMGLYALFGLILPRFVTIEQNGVYTLMTTLLFFGSMAASFGIPPILIRKIAYDPARAASIYVHARSAALSGIVVASALLLSYLAFEGQMHSQRQSERWVLALLIVGILLCDCFGSLTEALCQAHERMVYPAIVEAFTGLLRTGGAVTLLVVLPERQLTGVFACFLTGSALRVALLHHHVGRRYFPTGLPKRSWSAVLSLFRESLSVALFRVLRMVRNRVDSLLLGLLIVPAAGVSFLDAADQARGLYGQAMRVAFVLHTFTLALNTAVFPRLARIKGDLEEQRAAFGRIVRYQAWWAAPLAAWMFLYADSIAGWFGSQYRTGLPGVEGTTGQALRILLAAAILDCVGGPVGMLLLSRPSMDRVLPALGAALAATNVILNVLLIPRFGVLGAAWSSLGAALVEFLLKVYFVHGMLGGTVRLWGGVVPYLLLSGALAGLGAVTAAQERPMLGGIVGAIAYLVLTWWCGLVDPALKNRGSWAARRVGRPY